MNDHYNQKDVAPMAKHLARANESRVPFWRREWGGNPVWAWFLLSIVAGFAILHAFTFR
jgi:hypothetical protein